jgi:hypothetical protein
VRALATVSDTEDLGQRGAWRFTREYVVEPELTLVFYELYEAAFGPLRVRSIARQTLTEEEFTEQMVNGAVTKYVAWDADGRPVGLCALTPRLETVPWISPEYFAARYPEHWARGAVWYFNFLLAHPSQRHSRFLDQMVEVGIGELAAQGAVCAYDMCAYNDDQLGLGRRLSESLRRTTGVAATRTDTQNYYEVDFS